MAVDDDREVVAHEDQVHTVCGPAPVRNLVSALPDGSTMWNETSTGVCARTGAAGVKPARWNVLAGATVGTDGEPEPDEPHPAAAAASATSNTTAWRARSGCPREHVVGVRRHVSRDLDHDLRMMAYRNAPHVSGDPPPADEGDDGPRKPAGRRFPSGWPQTANRSPSVRPRLPATISPVGTSVRTG